MIHSLSGLPVSNNTAIACKAIHSTRSSSSLDIRRERESTMSRANMASLSFSSKIILSHIAQHSTTLHVDVQKLK